MTFYKLNVITLIKISHFDLPFFTYKDYINRILQVIKIKCGWVKTENDLRSAFGRQEINKTTTILKTKPHKP